jgi:hypothetical protein
MLIQSLPDYAHSWSRLVRPGAVVAALLAAGFAGAAYGAQPSAPASARPATAATSRRATNDEEAARSFTACMRSHGVPDFPGVTISADGKVHLDLGRSHIDPIASRFVAAEQACASLLPHGGRELPERPSPPPPASPSALCSGDCLPAPAPPRPPA